MWKLQYMAKMSFLCSVDGLPLDRVRSLVIFEWLRVEPSLQEAPDEVDRASGKHASLGRYSRYVPPGGHHGLGLGHAGQIMSLGWPGSSSGSPWMS